MIRNIIISIIAALAGCGAIVLYVILKHMFTVSRMTQKQRVIASKAVKKENWELFDSVAEAAKIKRPTGDVLSRAEQWLKKPKTFQKTDVDDMVRGLTEAIEAARKAKEEADKEKRLMETELRKIQGLMEVSWVRVRELEEKAEQGRKAGLEKAATTADTYGDTAMGKVHGKKLAEIIRGLK